jgi:hypothetical protein
MDAPWGKNGCTQGQGMVAPWGNNECTLGQVSGLNKPQMGLSMVKRCLLHPYVACTKNPPKNGLSQILISKKSYVYG